MHIVDFLAFYCLAPQRTLLCSPCIYCLLEMVRTKNTTRKYPTGLPPARFPSIATGMEERNHHYQQLQLIGEEAPTNDWTDLTPTFEEPVSPALDQAVDQLNQEYEELPPQSIEELSHLVEDLRDNPPTPVTTGKVMEVATEKLRSPAH